MSYMQTNASQSDLENRRGARHRTKFPTLLEHLRHGDVPAVVTNISAHGFMVEDCPSLQRGDRVNIRFPVVGQLEAYVIWVMDDRAGLQLERIIPLPEFMKLLDILQNRKYPTKRPTKPPVNRS